jgi:hypothetical protein
MMLEMGIPYPNEVLGSPLAEFWAAYGHTVVAPLLAWIGAGLILLMVGLLLVIFYLSLTGRMDLGPSAALRRASIIEAEYQKYLADVRRKSVSP